MIHNALSKSEVAFRYYLRLRPERQYTKREAIRQFIQDKHIDKKIVWIIVKQIFEEQKQLLNQKKI